MGRPEAAVSGGHMLRSSLVKSERGPPLIPGVPGFGWLVPLPQMVSQRACPGLDSWEGWGCTRWWVTGFTYPAVLLARLTRRRRSSRFGEQVEQLRTWCAATMGTRCSCSLERMRPWSTRKTARPLQGDRLTLFGFTGWGVDPLARHRWDT